MSQDKYIHNRMARLCSILGLYQHEITQKSVEDIIEDLEPYVLLKSAGSEELKVPEQTLLQFIMTGVLENEEAIQDLIRGALPAEWTLDRLEQVIRLILSAAIFELMFSPSLHQHILINEYVTIAGSFYQGKEVTFMNGILHQLAKKIRPEVSEPS